MEEKEIRTVVIQGKEFRYWLDENECWNAFGYPWDKGEYPCIKGKSIARFVYELLYGPLALGLVVRHKCDNRQCFNPAHILEGTHADNVRDRVERNRSAKGEKHGRSKLTEDDVREILKSEMGIRALARKHGVTPKAIRLIKQRVNWSHVA